MRSIVVCVGSSCHLRGAHQIIQGLKRLIADHALDDQIELKASFCLGECMRTGVKHPDAETGVTVWVDERNFYYLTQDNLNQFFGEVLMKQLPEKGPADAKASRFIPTPGDD